MRSLRSTATILDAIGLQVKDFGAVRVRLRKAADAPIIAVGAEEHAKPLLKRSLPSRFASRTVAKRVVAGLPGVPRNPGLDAPLAGNSGTRRRNEMS